MARHFRLFYIRGVHGVVVKGDAIDDADEEEGPVRTAFGDIDGAAIVDG